jgi:hypothetical protein
MAIQDSLMRFAFGLFFERPAQGKSFEQLHDNLEKSGREIEQRLSNATVNAGNLETVRHIVGIERWGQGRLQKALLGQQIELDRYRPYRPDDNTDWAGLCAAFVDTRAQSLELARQYSQLGHNPTVPHNQHAGFSAKGMFGYLQGHAHFESRKVR